MAASPIPSTSDFGKASPQHFQGCHHIRKKHTAIMDRRAVGRVLQSPGLLRRLPASRSNVCPTLPATRALSTVPRIAETSFWKSLIPKPWRRENRPVRDPKAPKQSWLSKEWNPATFFIIIFLLIGSMSIQMISLRNKFDAHTRRSEVRIGLLREVVERLQKGEQVDVEGVLGSGDSEKEAIWEEGQLSSVWCRSNAVLTCATVLNEIEKDAAVRNQKKQDKSKSPEPAPPAPPTAESASTSETPADSAPAKEEPKARTAYFF